MKQLSPGDGGCIVFIVMLNLFLGDFIRQEVEILKEKDTSFTDDFSLDLLSKGRQVLMREELD